MSTNVSPTRARKNADRKARHAQWAEETAKVVGARQATRDERTAAQQIAELDARLGKGQGATRERARLAA